MLHKAVMAWASDTAWNTGPSKNARSTKKKAAILKALLPKRLPTARSKAPNRTAAMVVTSSGNDVVIPTKDVPTNVAVMPDCSAIAVADPAKNGAATSSARADSPKPTPALRRPSRLLGCLGASPTCASTTFSRSRCLRLRLSCLKTSRMPKM